MTSSRTSLAAERIPYGSPVIVTGATCAISADLAQMDGVAIRGGAWEDAYDAGEVVQIQTDGGIKMVLAHNAEVAVNGILSRLLASEPHYVTLSEGKIVAC